MVWKLGGRNIRAGRSWVDENNITHPRNWMSWTDDEKRAAGLAWTDDPKPYDSTWYLGWNSDESALLPRPLAGLQASKVEEAKRQSANALSETDWYVVRKTETNVAVPTEITAYRTAVRTNYASLKTAINDASDIAELQAVYETTAGASNTIKTIDATSSSVVSTSSNTITISGHGFVDGEQVYYDAGINSDDETAAVIGGLMNNTIYFVHSAATNTFKLSESHSNCGDAAQVQFSSRSSDGTAHSFTSHGIPAKSQTWPNPKMTKYDGA